jgi:hypothetical protein
MAQKSDPSFKLSNEIYKTIVQPKEETLERLRGWKPPKHAYILFESKTWWSQPDGSRKLGTGLFTLNAESRADIGHHIDMYLAKGFRLIDYGNFPKFSDKNPSRAAKASHYSQGAGVNPWDNLENHIKVKMQQDIGWEDERSSMQNELNILRQKLMQEEKKKQVKEQIAASTTAKETTGIV